MNESLPKWQCHIEAIRHVYPEDPRGRRGVNDLHWEMIREGCLVHTNLNYVYVEYRPVAPDIGSLEYDDQVAYAAGSKVYFNGYFYEANQAVAKSETPSNSPTKWDELPIPYRWRRAIIEHTYALMVRYYAAMNQAENHEFYRANTHARNVLEEAIHEEQGQIGTLERVEVMSR